MIGVAWLVIRSDERVILPKANGTNIPTIFICRDIVGKEIHNKDMDIFFITEFVRPFHFQIYRPILMLPNIVFQIPQPSLIVIYQSLNIFPAGRSPDSRPQLHESR